MVGVRRRRNARSRCREGLSSSRRPRGAFDRDFLDITEPAATAALCVDVIVNCAARTAIGEAEEREADAFRVNAVGAANPARAAHRLGARIVHVSTESAFDGETHEPYLAGAALDSRSAHGRTKSAGECAVRTEAPDHFVVRTARFYSERGASFQQMIAQLVQERGSVQAAADQVGQPTWTRDVATPIGQLVDAEAAADICHETVGGLNAWYDFARAVVVADGGSPEAVGATASAEFLRPALRPTYSVLSHQSIVDVGFESIGDWAARWQVAAPDVLH